MAAKEFGYLRKDFQRIPIPMKHFIVDILLEYNALYTRVKTAQAKFVEVVCRHYGVLVHITLM